MSDEVFNQGLKKAFSLLKFRPRSRKEISEKLRLKNIPEKVIEQVLNCLVEKELINDEDFARKWAEDRFLFRRIGPLRIRKELQTKGIDTGVIDTVLSNLESVVSLWENAELFLRAKFRDRLTTVENRKLIDALVRNGYPYGISRDVVLSVNTDEKNNFRE